MTPPYIAVGHNGNGPPATVDQAVVGSTPIRHPSDVLFAGHLFLFV